MFFQLLVPVVVRPAERLQPAVPEQPLIATVRGYMIGDVGDGVNAGFQAHRAERFGAQLRAAKSFPAR